jgi:uncharacterized protein YjbJ (UPF0337 family)
LVRERTDRGDGRAQSDHVVGRKVAVECPKGQCSAAGAAYPAGDRFEDSRAAERSAPAVCRHHCQEQDMTINKDQVKGRVKEVKGKIKEVAGNLVGNESLEAKGTVQRLAGEAQAKFGDVKQDMKDAKKGS